MPARGVGGAAGFAAIGAVGGRAAGAGSGRGGDDPFDGPGSWRGGEGSTVVADMSTAASDAPQNLQNAAPASATPRQREHTRSAASFGPPPVPRSTTRIGAIAGGGAAGGGAGGAATDGGASSVLPHVVQ